MKRFTLCPDAAQDLDDIWEYIAEDSQDAADRFLGKLYEQILKLAESPGVGHRGKIWRKSVPFFSGQ